MTHFMERFEREWAPGLMSWERNFHRDQTFREVFEYLLGMEELLRIVEIGSMRPNGTPGGDGLSTIMWDALAEATGGTFYTVDIDPAATKLAAEHVKWGSTICGDSIHWLSSWCFGIDVLYLDSSDDPVNMLSEFAVANRYLHSGSVVMCDDTWEQGTQWPVKGALLCPLLIKIGAQILTNGPRQVAWIMP